jgi:hypothetical protein
MVVAATAGCGGAHKAPPATATATPTATATAPRPQGVQPPHGTTARARVLLGSEDFLRHGKGFGEARPDLIDAVGDPALVITHIRWRHWGAAKAVGAGRSAQLKLRGGYYRKQVRAELVAHGLGRCAPGAPVAYLELRVRMPPRPGARMGQWFEWGGTRGLCAHP